ncbi:MAG: hypothetical protein ACREM9_04390 [Gemmatimonadales bacterium]
MDRSVRWLTLLLVLAGCRDTRSGAGGEVASGEVARGMDGAGAEAGEPGVEFEAPRLIPGIRAQMTEIRDPEGATEGNLTAFRNGAGRLVSAMEADLQRVGVTDTGYFSVLRDSVMREFGGGAGNVASLSPEQGRQAAARIERLIELYEMRMRDAAN